MGLGGTATCVESVMVKESNADYYPFVPFNLKQDADLGEDYNNPLIFYEETDVQIYKQMVQAL